MRFVISVVGRFFGPQEASHRPDPVWSALRPSPGESQNAGMYDGFSKVLQREASDRLDRRRVGNNQDFSLKEGKRFRMPSIVSLDKERPGILSIRMVRRPARPRRRAPECMYLQWF